MSRAASLLGAFFAIVLTAWGSGAAAAVEAPGWIGWQTDTDQPQTHRIGKFTLITSVQRAPGGASIPVLVVRSKGRPPLKVVGSEGLSTPSASVLVMPADRPRGHPVILFRSYTGGAHCCEDYRLIEPRPKGWRVSRIGQWDGSGPEPQDADGDGRFELVARDQRFNYRLTSHAESVMPPVVYEIRNGRLADVSAQPRFRPLFRKELEGLRESCAASESPVGPCLGYIAIAARVGEAAGAIAVIDAKPLTSDSNTNGWAVPKHCGGSPAGCAHEEPQKKLPNRHDAVIYFLTDLGYLPESAP